MDIWFTNPFVPALAALATAVGLGVALRHRRTANEGMATGVMTNQELNQNLNITTPADFRLPFQGEPPVESKKRVLIIGAGSVGRTLARALTDDGKHEVVGFIDDNIDTPDSDEYRILGNRANTLKIVDEYRVDEVVLAYAPTWQQELAGKLTTQHPNVAVRVVPSPFEALMKVDNVESYGDIAVVRLVTRIYGFEQVVKRCFDFMAALIGLILLAPLFAVVAVLVRLSSKGPVIFRQERVGREGKPFWLVTTHVSPEAGPSRRRANGLGPLLRRAE